MRNLERLLCWDWQDCPRNVGNSAKPPAKEDLISIFVKKNATSSFYFPFQCKITKEKKKEKHVFLSSWNQKVFPPLPSGNKKKEKKKNANGQGGADMYGIQITQ